VAQMGCRATGSLALKDEGNLKRFGECGAIRAVVEALKIHYTDIYVAEYGCRAVANLAYQSKHVSMLGEAGACEIVVTILNDHQEEDTVMRQACLAVRSLCVRRLKCKLHIGNSTRLVNSGVLPIIVGVMEKHLVNEFVATASAMAVGGLAKDPMNRNNLGYHTLCILYANILYYHYIYYMYDEI
jgi:hypothetical protein